MKINCFWFRRDLRLEDNAGLHQALSAGLPVLCIFIFDRNILDHLPQKDARVAFIHSVIHQLNEQLQALGSSIYVVHGKPDEVWEKITQTFDIQTVFTNRDYEPYALARDSAIEKLLHNKGVAFKTFKDHLIFEKDEVLKQDGTPYTVFTPYSRTWKKMLDSKQVEVDGKRMSYYFQSYPTEKYVQHFYKTKTFSIPSLEDMGFMPTNIAIPSKQVKQGIIKQYDQMRNFPAVEGTSRLGIHFRFGTISIRQKAQKAMQLNETFLNELIWREFYAMILAHFPHVVKNAFREKYDHIKWRNDEKDFKKWCEGKTGYPIVDAGMRELNTTGYMHNRVRMITASFLTKHLLIDWRWGEAYFAEKLLDFELASNNGGWQWAAGSGTDAAPYFRIFNPDAQQAKFDKEMRYIKTWVPEYGTPKYSPPMVEHKMARERCLATYKSGLEQV